MRGGVEKHRFFAQDAEQDGHTVASLIWQLNAALSKERPLDRDGSRTLASHRLELCTNLTSCEIKLPKFSRCAGSTRRALRALRPGEIGRTPSEMAKNRVNIPRRNIFSTCTRKAFLQHHDHQPAKSLSHPPTSRDFNPQDGPYLTPAGAGVFLTFVCDRDDHCCRLPVVTQQ